MNKNGKNDHSDLRHPGASPESEQRFLSKIYSAIQRDELVLHYQPRFSAEDGYAHIVEALVRWEHPNSGLFYPELFLPVAERHGLIFNIDLWVFEQCCRDLKWLRENIDREIRLAMNISVLECESIFFSQKLITTCEKHELSFSDFEFEITESNHARDYRKLIAFCETLHELGATFSLDDFGRGQSSLRDICRLPVELIKIDKSFVRAIDKDPKVRVMVEYIVEMAHKMDILVAAEGVQNEYQCDVMLDLGCDQLQGFYLCKPDLKDQLRFSL